MLLKITEEIARSTFRRNKKIIEDWYGLPGISYEFVSLKNQAHN